jgi:hypothetical protein
VSPRSRSGIDPPAIAAPAFLALFVATSALGGAASREDEDLEAWFGTLRVGMWLRVEGRLAPDGVLRASRVKVYDGELDEAAVESDVVAVDLVRMTVETRVGVRALATPKTDIEGPRRRRHLNLMDLAVGDVVDIEGRLRRDGSLLAEKIEIEKAGPRRPDPPRNNHKLTAPIESIDAAGRRIVVFGLSVQVGEDARFRSSIPD